VPGGSSPRGNGAKGVVPHGNMAVVLAPLAGAGMTVAGEPQVWPSNRLVTEPSLNTSLIARASSGAIESTVSLSNRFS
jgi:hypothetical protein